MGEPQYRFLDHTGDFGVEIDAPDLPAAVSALARSFLDLLTGDPASVAAVEEREVVVEGVDLLDALVAFGNELLYLFEVEGFLCAEFEADVVDEQGIEGVARGERFDPARHPIARPLKAVTHHGVHCEERDDGVHLRLIFDL